MKKNLRKTLLLSAMALCIGGVAFGVNTVKTNADVFTPSVKMVAGASVRIVKNDDAVAESGNGIRFTTYMAKADYETLMAENSGYTDVQFGVLVAPNTSAYTLTEKSVFGTGEDKKYAWAEWADTDGDGTYAWEYDATANAAYTRIMNFSSEKMYLAEYEWEDEANVYFRGSAIDINENNVPYEFQGIGYIKYTYGGATKYQFTTAETRSMTYVAQRAIEENDANATWLQQKYVVPYMQGGAKETATKYTVEHYFEQADGTYKLDETLTEQDTAFIGATITSNAKDVAYYQFNDAKAENKVGGTAYANDKLVLKRYYKLAAEETVDLGLKDTNDSETTVSIAGVPEVLTKKLYKMAGLTKIEVAADLTGETIALDGLNGVYMFEATKADGTVIVSKQFDVYDSTEATVWTDNTIEYGYALYENAPTAENSSWVPSEYDSFTVVNGSDEGATGNANYYKVNVLVEAGEYAKQIAIKALPLHSKAYYQVYADLGYKMSASVKMDVYTTPTDGSDPVGLTVIDSSTFYGTNQWITNAGFKTYTIDLATLLTKWGDTGTIKDFPTVYMTSAIWKDQNYLAKSITLYAGNISLAPVLTGYTTETATTTTLLDVTTDGAKTYDLSSLLTVEANKTALVNYLPYVNWTFTFAADATVVRAVSGTNTADLSGFRHGIYNVTASVGEAVLFSGSMDIYNSTEFELYDFALLPNTMDTITLGDTDMHTAYGITFDSGNGWAITQMGATVGIGKANASTVTLPENCSGDYIAIQFSRKDPAAKIMLSVMHSEEYYKLYTGKTIQFNVWSDKNHSNFNSSGYITGTLTANTALFGSVSIDTLLADWANVSAGKHLFIDAAWGSFETVGAILYVGGFSLVE